jgi:alpha-L-rhamnosidase
MFGGGITWFYQVLAGMNPDPENPGYRHIVFRPQPATNITTASYANKTTYGRASIGWKKEGKKFIMDIEVPAGCTATVHVPTHNASKVKESNKKHEHSPEVSFQKEEGGYAIFKVGSGKYQFISQLKKTISGL